MNESLKDLTADELDARRRAVLIEQERRQKLEQLPDDLAVMARDAASAGCDRDELLGRVTDALTPEQVAARDT